MSTQQLATTTVENAPEIADSNHIRNILKQDIFEVSEFELHVENTFLFSELLSLAKRSESKKTSLVKILKVLAKKEEKAQKSGFSSCKYIYDDFADFLPESADKNLSKNNVLIKSYKCLGSQNKMEFAQKNHLPYITKYKFLEEGVSFFFKEEPTFFSFIQEAIFAKTCQINSLSTILKREGNFMPTIYSNIRKGFYESFGAQIISYWADQNAPKTKKKSLIKIPFGRKNLSLDDSVKNFNNLAPMTNIQVDPKEDPKQAKNIFGVCNEKNYQLDHIKIGEARRRSVILTISSRTPEIVQKKTRSTPYTYFCLTILPKKDPSLEKICASVFTSHQGGYYSMPKFLMLLTQTLVFTNTKRLPYKADPLKIYQIDWADWWRHTIQIFYTYFSRFQTAL